MDRFLELNNLPKLNEEVESLKKPIRDMETEAVIKNFSQEQKPHSNRFSGEF